MRLIDLFRKQVPATDEVGLEPATAGVPGAGGSDALVARSAGRTCRFGHEDATAAAGLSGQGDADFCSPFEFATSMRTASGLEFDVMLESKVKDLALIRLRPDMLRYAEDVASRFGLTPTQAPALESEQAALLEEQAASGA